MMTNRCRSDAEPSAEIERRLDWAGRDLAIRKHQEEIAITTNEGTSPWATTF
jgi:hypothetical protein